MLSRNGRQHIAGSPTIRYRWRLLPNERGVPACLSYMVEGDRIRLPSNPAGVKFDFPIGDVVETEDTIVICLLVPEGRKCSENVYAIDHSGNLRWRIAAQAFEAKHGPYVALSFHGSVVSLYTRDGKGYRVNARDGSKIA
ncbi:MAG TPA: hypothetical protein VI685_14790 [Candidatus Angelobacter sp.]